MLPLVRVLPGAHRPQYTLRLRTNVSWAVAGNLAYALTQWMVLSALAKLGNPEMVGYYALAAVLVNPIIAFANLQLRSLQATEVALPYRFADYFGVRLVTTAGAFAVAVVVATAFSGSDRSLVIIILLVMMRKCIDSLSDVCFGSFQRRERMDCVAISLTLTGILSLAGLAATVYLTDSLALGLVTSLVTTILVLCLYTLPATRHVLSTADLGTGDGDAQEFGSLRPRWSPSAFPGLVKMAAPLGLVTLLVSVGENAPGYLVGRELGPNALGMFAALWYVTSAGSTAVNAIAQSLSPRMAQLFARGAIPEFRRLLGGLVVIGLSAGVLGGLLVLVTGKHLLTVAYSAEYVEGVRAFFILVVGAGVAFAASFLGYGMIAARQLRAQVPLLGTVAFVAVASSALLIPRFGLSGAAVAIGGANVVQLLGSLVVLARAPAPERMATL